MQEMEVSDIESIINELKDFRLIDCNRNVVSIISNRCTFHAKGISSSIEYDLNLLNFLSKDEFLWIVLHEEYHLTHKLRSKTNNDIDLVISGVLTFILSFLIALSLPTIFLQFVVIFTVLMSICFGILFILTTYIHKKYFPQSFYQDEFDADEYAVKGLLLIRPHLIAWQVMYSSFQSFVKCWGSREKKKSIIWLRRLYLKLYLKLYLILRTAPHPENKDRIKKVRVLFNKYNLKRREVENSTIQ
jgi:hypothetical protein